MTLVGPFLLTIGSTARRWLLAMPVLALVQATAAPSGAGGPTVTNAKKPIADALRNGGNFLKSPQRAIVVLEVRGNQATPSPTDCHAA
jgi:hypothetical protein